MLSYIDAMNIIYEQNSSAVKIINIENNYNSLLGLICADDVYCQKSIPSFKNSAMDGYVLQSSYFKTLPCKVTIQGTIAAGDLLNFSYSGVWEIMTGASIPHNYDAVIKIEDVEILSSNNNSRPTEVLINQAIIKMQNIRKPGSDYTKGDCIIKKGEQFNSRHIMAFSTLGLKSFKTFKRPSVILFTTGNELLTNLEKTLNTSKIHDSNSYYLHAECFQNNIIVLESKSIKDNKELFTDNLKSALNSKADIIISTGAVSEGRFDFIHECVKNLGAKILFHKVAIKPGKPLLFAVFPNGKYYFGLPGNPISTAICFRFFVIALIRSMQHQKPESTITAKMNSSDVKLIGFKYFRKAIATVNSKAILSVELLDGQESYKISPMPKANCWAIYDEKQTKINANDLVEVLPFDPNFVF